MSLLPYKNARPREALASVKWKTPQLSHTLPNSHSRADSIAVSLGFFGVICSEFLRYLQLITEVDPVAETSVFRRLELGANSVN